MQLRQIKRRLRSYSKSYYFDLATPKETFFLASSQRSGSTWIQEVFSKTGSYRILFEPFHSHEVKHLADWEYRQYIGRAESGAEFIDAVRSIIKGKIRHEWIDQDNRVFFPTKRFIKETRGNLFIAWLKTQFPWVRLIFLTRHPFAIARSRMKLGWRADLDILFRQANLIQKHFANDLDLIRSTSSEFGKQVAFWSMENVVPLRELSASDAFAISYEDIIYDPQAELKRISSTLGIPIEAIDSNVLMKPSRTSWPEAEKTAVSSADIQEGWRILRHFGLDRLYGKNEETLPELAKRDIFAEFESDGQ